MFSVNALEYAICRYLRAHQRFSMQLITEGKHRPFLSGRKVVGRCPRCGCDVTESKMGYFCEGVDCRFAMWRDNKYLVNKRAVLTAPLVTELLEKGRAKLTGLYSERTGKIYDAILVMEDDGQQLRYSLEFNRG